MKPMLKKVLLGLIGIISQANASVSKKDILEKLASNPIIEEQIKKSYTSTFSIGKNNQDCIELKNYNSAGDHMIITNKRDYAYIFIDIDRDGFADYVSRGLTKYNKNQIYFHEKEVIYNQTSKNKNYPKRDYFLEALWIKYCENIY